MDGSCDGLTGFHMIATITVIAAIAEKKKFSDHMETTLQRSQRQRSLYISAIVVAAIAREQFHMIAAIAEVFFFFLSDHSDRSDHMETGF